MNVDILQRFLNKRLIDIGEDDARLEKLRAAAADVSEGLLQNRGPTVRLATVAFDPEVDADDPSWGVVAPAIERHWNTYASRFASTPQILFRAVLLEALRLAASKDIEVAAALVAVARNLVPHLQLQLEYDTWKEVIETAGQVVSERAADEWAADFKPAEAAGRDVARTNDSPPKVDREGLAAGLLAASGPNTGQNKAIPDANPNWPSANGAWTTEFAQRAASVIAKAIDTGIAAISTNKSKSDQEFLASIRAAADDALAAVRRASVGIQRRGDLLWWKEAMWSPSAKVSYRKLQPAMAAVLMAVDLHHRVPRLHPESVEFFLAEAVREAIGAQAASAPVSLREVVAQCIAHGASVGLDAAFASFRQTDGRGSLIGYLGEVLAGGPHEHARCVAALGARAALELSPPDVSVWVFRELQAASATAGRSPSLPAPQKSKASKGAQPA